MDSFPIFFGKCVIQKLSIFNCKKFQTLSRLRLQCNSLKTHAHFTDKIAKLISGKYDFINKYDRQYHQFDIYIYVKLLHNYDKSPTVTSCLIWVTVFFLLELSARTLPYEYDSRGQCILCMLEKICQFQNRCVKSTSIFFTNPIQIRTPHDGIYVLFCANSRNVCPHWWLSQIFLKSINSAQSSLFQKKECWDEKHIKSCDNKPRTRKSKLLFEGTILDRCF